MWANKKQSRSIDLDEKLWSSVSGRWCNNKSTRRKLQSCTHHFGPLCMVVYDVHSDAVVHGIHCQSTPHDIKKYITYCAHHSRWFRFAPVSRLLFFSSKNYRTDPTVSVIGICLPKLKVLRSPQLTSRTTIYQFLVGVRDPFVRSCWAKKYWQGILCTHKLTGFGVWLAKYGQKGGYPRLGAEVMVQIL